MYKEISWQLAGNVGINPAIHSVPPLLLLLPFALEVLFYEGELTMVVIAGCIAMAVISTQF